MKKSWLIMVLIFVSLISIQPVSAQNDTTISVRFGSLPIGAEVFLDGSSVGITPLTLDIRPGEHHVSFVLLGFREWTADIMIFESESTVYAYLQGEDNLLQLYHLPQGAEWSNQGNQLQFDPYQGTNPEPLLVKYDFNTETTAIDAFPWEWLNDNEVRQQLNIVGIDGENIVAYTSPSGRYIGFPQRSDDGRWMLSFYDRQNDKILSTRVPVHGTTTDTTWPLFRLWWSPDETIVGWGAPFDGAYIYAFIGEGEPRITFLQGFTATTGEELYIEGVASPPSNDGQVLVFNGTERPVILTRSLWLVDLATMIGTRVPIDGVFDAAFLPTDQDTIIVAHSDGISQISINDLDHSELISTIVSDQWVTDVDLSSTSEYALISSEFEAGSSYWIYKLP